jgi:hypothetical protein
MAASVVDFPEPVGPVTSTMPWESRRLLKMPALQLVEAQHFGRIVRITAPAPRFCTNALTRKRADWGWQREIALEAFVVFALPVVHDVVDHGVHVLVLYGGRLMR